MTHDDCAVALAERDTGVLLHKKHARAVPVRHGAYCLKQSRHDLRRKAETHLVKHQQAWLAYERCCESDHLLLAA